MTDQLAQARAAVGVTGGEPLPGKPGLLVGLSAMAAMAAAFGVVARLLVDRQGLASTLRLEASAIDDRVVRILLLTVFVAVVVGLASRGRHLAGTRIGVGIASGVLANILLAMDANSGRLDTVVALAALSWGLTFPAVPASLAARVQPGARVLALRLSSLGLPLAVVLTALAVVNESAATGSALIAFLGLFGGFAAWQSRGSEVGLDQKAVHAMTNSEVGEVETVPFAQMVRRVLSRNTLVHAGFVAFGIGVAIFPLPLFIMLRLGHDFEIAPTTQAFAVAIAFGAAFAFLIAGLRDVMARHAQSVGGPSDRAKILLAVACGLLYLGIVVNNSAALVLFASIAIAFTWSSWSRVQIAAVISTPHAIRLWSMTFLSIMQLLGALISLAVIAGVDSRFGTGWALALAAFPIGAVSGSAARIARSADMDLNRTLGQFLGAVEIAQRRAAGVHVPLLEARNINFSYGQVQVLFGVDFTVDDGEMVALLGTNGAGKSTLLRVISGLGLPSNGTVRLSGTDITFASPGDRVHAGVAQVPGGKAVFGPLSVVENMRVHAHALGRDRAVVDQGIEAAFEQFPRLAERRDQMAQTLSGGEQQMLALSKALILKPRLLLIDELSLGLAPVIVAQLLDMVRAINASGTAVVLVEQSVNVALSLANHAYYMEKGEVRFDGAAKDLLERPDVLRSVYLKGAAEGLGGKKR